MKIVVIMLLSVFSILIGFEIYSFSRQARALERGYAQAQSALERAQQDRAALEEDAAYYARPENVEKEARRELNDKAPGEHTIILVSPTVSSTLTQ